MSELEKKCPYCDFDGNGNGLEYYTDQPVDEEELSQLDGMDGGRAYLHKGGNGVSLVTNEPDGEMWGRETTATPVNCCPWCRRGLSNDD